MSLDRLCNTVHAWYLRRLVGHVNACAAAGDKQGHAATMAELNEFRQLLEGDPRFEPEEVLREKWGTAPEAESGQNAMLAMPGVAGFVLDDDGPHRLDNPGEAPLVNAYRELNDVERAAGLDPTAPPWDAPAG